MNSSECFYDSYTSNSNETIVFKIVKAVEDLQCEQNSFRPQYSHQFFGEAEKIVGYKSPKIKLYFSASSLSPYFNFAYDEMVMPENNIIADDVQKILLDKVDNVTFDIGIFKDIVENDRSDRFGKLIHQYVKMTDCGEKNVFEINHVTGQELQSDRFKMFNDRLQYFLLFFVDGSSFIDITDCNWEYFIVYQKLTDIVDSVRYVPVGFMTVYNFFAYPDKIRQRISQVLILPPFQRQGHGAELLNSFYCLANTNSSIKDVTVEDPSDQFQILRDYVDCRNVLELSEFDKDMIKKGLFKKFSQLIKEKLKMTNKQIIRMFELLSLKFLNRSNVIEGMKFKQSIIIRLTTLFGKAKDFAHVEAQAYLTMGQEQKAIMIEREYERLEEYYVLLVNKLNKSML